MSKNFFDQFTDDSDTVVSESGSRGNYFDQFDESAPPPQTIVARRKPLLPDVLGKEPAPDRTTPVVIQDNADVPIKLNPLANTGVNLPSEFSSGMGGSVPISENPDYGLLKGIAENPVGFLKSLPSDAQQILESAAAGAGNLPAHAYHALPDNIKPYAKPLLEALLSKGYVKESEPKFGAPEGEEPLPFHPGVPIWQPRGTVLQPEGNPVEKLLSGFTTPGMVASFPFAASKAAQLFFITQTAPGAIEAAEKLVSSDIPADQRREAATDLLINTIFTAGLARGLSKKSATGAMRPKVIPPTGEPVIGKSGQTHDEIIKQNDLPKDSERAFDLGGETVDREDAAKLTGIETKQEPGKLHSEELAKAQEAEPPVNVAPVTGKVTEENIDSLTPEQLGTLRHRDGIRYGLSLPQSAQKRLQEKYDAAGKEMQQAALKNDSDAMHAAFGKGNFFGGALMGVTRGEHPISGSNYTRFIQEHPELAPKPPKTVAAPVETPGSRPATQPAAPAKAKEPTAAPALESKIVDLINAPYTGAEKAAAMKKMAAEKGITTKAMQEQVEAHVVRMSNIIANEPALSFDQKFDKLKKLYDYQPRFTGRTSTSVADQAYSTPVPLAYALNHAIGSEGMDVYEPTAGNGALLIGADHELSDANEKNPDRAAELRKSGVGSVTEEDATTHKPQGGFSRVHTNPPFGAIDNVNIGGYGIKRLEHLISLKALDAMKDDGAGYMILGAALHSAETGKGAQRVFENYLYGHYNVVDNFEVSGDLYSNQGASFPVRVLVVNGRRAKPIGGELSPKSVDRLGSWDDVWSRTEKIRNEIDRQRQALGTGRPAAIPVPVVPQREPAKVGGKPAVETGATPTGAVVGGKPAGDRGGKQPVEQQPPGGRTPRPSAKPAVRPENAPGAARPAGGAKLPAGGVEGENVRGSKAPFDAKPGSDQGSGEPVAGIVSRPDSVIDAELKNLDDIDALIDDASAANVEEVVKRAGPEGQLDLLGVDKSKPIEAQIVQLRRMADTAERLDKPATLKAITRRITELQAQQLGREVPERSLMDRITEGYDKAFPGKDNSKTARYLHSSITKGEFNDMMRPANKTSRKLFTDLTGVKLPSSERDTRKLFNGKPFDVLPEGTETYKGKHGETKIRTVEPAPATAATQAERSQRTRRIPESEKVAREEPPTKSSTDIIRDAAKHGVAGVDEAMNGLNKLFGGGTHVGAMGPTFDEKTYAEAKPHFEKAWTEFQKSGKSLKEYAQFILKNFSDAVKPYLKRFLEDKKTAPVETPKADTPPKVKGTEFQVPYEPRSEAPAFGTLIPKSIAGGVHAYLDELKTRVGPLDEFVSKEVDMPLEQLRKVAAAEQIDGAAMAIDQIKNDGATIVGDQTGIGKGRQAALVIRWALKNGSIPIFFTKDPKLFSDMYGDLADIYDVDGPRALATTIKPFILGDVGKATIVDTDGNVIHRSPSKRLQDEGINNILDKGLTESGYNTIFATYSQINERNARQQFLERLANDNPVVLIMDESHDAAGNSDSSMQSAFFQGGRVRRGSGADMKFITVPGLLRASGTKSDRGGGVMYLSATFAKRPENMPVYFRTSLQKAADSFQQIVDAMQRGGVALQQAVSEALAKAGQYVRREREFTGVSYNMLPVDVANEAELIDHVDQVTDVLQQIVEFSKDVRASQEGSTAMTGAQIDMTDFASVVHNQIGQLLLAAKADAVVENAIKAHKAGEKPVIALMNTMESFLDHYATDNNIKAGDPIQLRWNELLSHALKRTLRYSEELPNGDTIIRSLDPKALGEHLESLYNSIEETARGIESKFPVSPIDYILQKLNKAGVKMVELTGRHSGIEYADFENGRGTYKGFPAAKKNQVVNGFNNGTYDGMLMNASGSTGLSAHASAKFKDQRPRHMFIAQPAADINTFVQTLGRIFRTGLVMKGIDEKGLPYGAKYSHMVLPLQAELRPAAMAARKMKSLNANTTAEADNAIKIESEDFMNRYGDAIVADYLDQDQDLQDKLDIMIDHKQDGTPEVKKELARTFTGRMSRMPDAWQKAAYEHIIPAYRELIQQLKNTGEYDLEIVTHDDWDGVRESDEELTPGTDENNIFTSSVRLQEWSITDTRHVPSGQEMTRELTKNYGSPQKLQETFSNFVQKANERLQARSEEYRKQLADPNLNEVAKSKIENSQRVHDEAVQRWENQTSSMVSEVLQTAGKVVNLSDAATGESYDAMLVDFKMPNSNRLAPSAFRFKFMLDAPGGVAYITGSQFNPEHWSIEPSDRSPADLKGGRKGARYQRHFIVGNPIRGYAATGGKGKVVRFKAHDGQTITGLLMPKNWGPENLANDPRLDLVSGSAVKHYLLNHTSPYGQAPVESGGIVSISRSRMGSGFLVKTGAARRDGGSIFLDKKLTRLTGDFTKVGNRMEVTIDDTKLDKVADVIREITHSPFRPSVKDDSTMLNVSDSNNKTRGKGGKGIIGMGGAIPEEFENSPQTPTSTKNAQVDIERRLRGLPAAMEPARRSFGTVWDEAMARIDQDPTVSDRLIDELRDHPRAVTDAENALLLHQQITLQNEYGKRTRDMAAAYDDAKEFPNRMDEVESLKSVVAGLSDRLFDLYEINKHVGTETGRGLNARKMMAYEDYTLAEMEVRKRAARDGRPLTDEEHEQIRQLHDQIEKLRKDYDEYVAQAEARIAELEADKAIDDAQRKGREAKKTGSRDIEARKDRIVGQIADKLDQDKRNEISGAVQRLARLFVEEGVDGRDDLIDKVHGVLLDLDPEITRRDAMDAISGYGDFKQMSKDDISVELRDLKGQMQQVAKLEDMQEGQPPLKTGIERRIPSKEESRLIKLVNEAKRKFQIPITDPNTQLRSSLDELKKRMQTRTEELEKKLAEGDFAPRPAKEPIKLDAKALELKAKYERAKQAFEHGLQIDRLKNRTTLEKMQDTLVRWRRGFLLSSPITLAKLTAAAVQRMTITPMEEAIGGVYSKMVPKVAAKSPREGGFNSRAEAKALADAVTQGMKDARQVLNTGQSQLDILFGRGREGYVGEQFILPRSVVDFFGQLHGALKAPVKRAEFSRALEKRSQSAIAHGVDVTDPLVMTRLMVESYKDANRAIFLQDNRVVAAYKSALARLEQKDKATGRIPASSKLLATAAKTAFPIVKVPTNIIAETFQYALGTVTGSARLALAMRRGIDNLKPEEADLIMRELKKGSIGAAVLLWGYFNPQFAGGYYQMGQKRKPEDVKYGSIRIFDVNIPSFLLHNPLLETAQLGATIRRVADSKLRKKDSAKQGITAGLIAGGLGLTEEVPFVKDTLDLTKLWIPYERNQFVGEYEKSMLVPQLLQYIANQQDKDKKGNTIKRNPKGLIQNLETGIPYLRQDVPKKNPLSE